MDGGVSKERILVVDDEPQILVALEDLLGDDFTIVKSQSPENALRVVEEDPNIAVVITDHRMPRMSGGEFLARLGDSTDTTRIMVTGFADLSGVIRAVNDGGIFAYNMPFHGSLPWLKSLYGGTPPPALRVRAVDDGSGYYIMGSDGAVFAFGNARFHGSAPGFNPVDMMLMP